MLSIVSIKGFEAFSVYSATKAAVRSFARSWTADLKGRKIRVNALSPGPIETPAFDKAAPTEGEPRADQGGLRRGCPAGPDRPAGRGSPGPPCSSASDDSSFVTGIELFVDGGMAQV